MIILPTMSRDNQTMLNTRINNKCKDFVLTIEYISLRLSIRIFDFNYAKILWEHLS